eukprot:TRINITY_DN3264_c0_g1_i5.p1 TRINITY_DN3264_c0_g1~~TRINITY_DN3264_c0_g1_i5.p1  ORF type:complete len:262 (+),score=-11.86 TRINITY_DN3264_c0_g1_i5:1521-2306(+)
MLYLYIDTSNTETTLVAVRCEISPSQNLESLNLHLKKSNQTTNQSFKINQINQIYLPYFFKNNKENKQEHLFGANTLDDVITYERCDKTDVDQQYTEQQVPLQQFHTTELWQKFLFRVHGTCTPNVISTIIIMTTKKDQTYHKLTEYYKLNNYFYGDQKTKSQQSNNVQNKPNTSQKCYVYNNNKTSTSHSNNSIPKSSYSSQQITYYFLKIQYNKARTVVHMVYSTQLTISIQIHSTIVKKILIVYGPYLLYNKTIYSTQ